MGEERSSHTRTSIDVELDDVQLVDPGDSLLDIQAVHKNIGRFIRTECSTVVGLCTYEWIIVNVRHSYHHHVQHLQKMMLKHAPRNGTRAYRRSGKQTHRTVHSMLLRY